MIKVYQIRIKLYIFQDIPIQAVQSKLAALIDKGFKGNERLSIKHEENTFKNYCFDLLYPIEGDKRYHKGKIYTVTIRTIEEELAQYFSEICVNQYTQELKALTADIKILPKKFIKTLYSLTPIILKTESGYWKSCMALHDFEERLKINLIKKWNTYENTKLDENFQFYTLLEFLNDSPIVMEYKNIKLLGDKIRLQIADNAIAQDLAYMSLGTGLCEMNARGAGFLNYRWM